MSTRKENAVSRIRKKQQQQQQQQQYHAAVAAAAANRGTLYGFDYTTAASSSSSDNIYSDPFHNGQTPACKLLRRAVNDIFPELQQQEHYPIPQSQLGKLLRWQFFKNRRERRQKIQNQQDLILASNNEETSENTSQAATATDQSTTGNTTSSSKRKKKKKKKKKTGAGAGTAQGTGGDTTITAPGSPCPSNREIPSVTLTPPPPQHLPEAGLDEFQMELKDETTEHSSTFLQLDEKSVGDISVDLLDEVIDKSLKVHDTQMQQANAEAHSLLESLPSDEMKPAEENNMEQSISAYFQQIQPEATSFPQDNDMLSSPSGGTSASGRGHHPQSGLVADSILVSPPFPPPSNHDEKILSSPPQTPVSSKHHLNNGGGVSTSPTRNKQQRPSPPSNISNNQIDLMNSPTHEWIPTDGDSGGGSQNQTNHETAQQLAVIKNPLELPFLLTLKNTDSGNGVVTTTSAIDGSLIPVESNHKTSGSAEAEDNAPGSYETTKALLEEWLDQLDSNTNGESNENETNGEDDDRKAHGEYQSFLEYLQKRCYIHNSNSKNTGNPGSKKKKGTGGIIAQFQTIQDYVSGIDCPNCRQDAFVELEKLQQKSGPFMLCTKCLKDPPKPTDESIDAAFDYVALEEGRHMNLLPTAPTLSTSSITEDDDEEGAPADKANNLCLVLVEPSSKQQQQSKSSKNNNNNNNNSKQLFLESLTSTQLDTLVEQWLPCGIEEDVMVTTSVVQTPPSTTEGTQTNDDDNFKQQQQQQQQPKKRVGGGSIVLQHAELTDLQNRVLRHENSTRIKLLGLQAEGQELMDQLDTFLTSTTQAVNFEVSKYPELKNCDDRCHEYSEKLLEILLSCTSERSHALADIQLQLWTTLLEGLNGALLACDIYYDKLQNDLIDQTGALPRIFLSKPLRDVYHALLHEKARLWTNIGTTFVNVLLPSSPGSTSRILNEWYTRSVWEQHELRNNHNSAIPIDNRHDTTIHESDEYVPNDPLDDKCHEIVEKLVRWTDAKVGGHIRDIQKDRMKQTSAILKLLQSTVEPLSKEYSTVERFFSKDRNQYFASLRSNITLAQGVKDMMRLIDDKEVKYMALGALVMWRHVRIMQSRMDIAPTSSVLTPSQGLQLPRPLPLQLKRWYLLQDDDRFIDSGYHGVWSNPSYYGHHQMFCQLGTGGKRRLTCLLVGLIYQWLEQECQEWKAAKAEQELLGDFDNLMGKSTTTSSSSGDLAMLDSNNNKNGGVVQQQKSGKSNKKKKKKNRNSSVAAAAPDSSLPHNENKNNGNTTAEGSPLSSSSKAICKADDNEQSDNDKNRTAVKAEGKDATNRTGIVAHKEESAAIVAADEGKDFLADTDVVATKTYEKLAAGNENLSDDYAPGRGVEESKDFEREEVDEACTPNIGDVKTKEPPSIPPDATEASDRDPEEEKVEEKVEEETISEHVIDQLCFENVKISDNRNNTIFTPGDFLIGRLEAIMQNGNKTNNNNNNKKKKNVVVMI